MSISIMMRSNHKNFGFTLIEILVALMIFAILGTIAAIGLRSVIKGYEGIKQTDQGLRQMQLAFLIMQRDFTQLINRPVMSSSGEELPALIINSTNNIEFTSGGFVNPGSKSPRSTLIRVGYTLDNHDLVRLTWSVLDRPSHIDPQQRILLHNVKEMHFEYVNDHGQLVNTWPTSQIQSFPQAIIVYLKLPHFGEWKGVFPIMGRGYEN